MADVEQHAGEIDGVPVSWRSAPFDGVPTLYVHGVPNSSVMWTPFLARTGGIAVDLPGFGDSVKAGTFPYSIAGYRRLHRAASWTGSACRRFNLVVHDWGAAALAFAQRAPARVERLVVINALPLFDGYQWHRVGADLAHPAARRAVRWARSRRARCAARCATPTASRSPSASCARSTAARLRHPARDPASSTAACARARSPPPASSLGEIDAPALVVWGELDPYIPARAATQYAHALGGPVELELLARRRALAVARPSGRDRSRRRLPRAAMSGPLASRLRDVCSHRVNAGTLAPERRADLLRQFCLFAGAYLLYRLGRGPGPGPNRHGAGLPPRQRDHLARAHASPLRRAEHPGLGRAAATCCS